MHESEPIPAVNRLKANALLADQSETALLIPDILLIKQLHRLLFNGMDGYQPGSLRTGESFVRLSVKSRILHCHPEEIQQDYLAFQSEARQLVDAFDNISAGPHSAAAEKRVIFVAFFHARLIQMHPFWDGNGRCSRLLAQYQLLSLFDVDVLGAFDESPRQGFGDLSLGRGFGDFDENYYISAMDAVIRGDLSPLVRYFHPRIPPEGIRSGISPPFSIRLRYK